VVSFSILIFIYGVQKIAQLKAVREIRVYLADIQNEALEGSHQIEQMKRKYLAICVILTIIFTILFIWGIIKAMST
jgi:hypothetical protein